jgi:hypothetical protein
MDGLEGDTRDARAGLFGDNVIEIEEKPVLKLLVDEVPPLSCASVPLPPYLYRHYPPPPHRLVSYPLLV